MWSEGKSKIARRCGEKHISKPKCQKTDILRALFEVPMSKNCTPLWREVNFEVKRQNTDILRALFEVPMSKNCTPLWREARFQVKMLKN